MALNVDRNELDKFSVELFRTLDSLGLLPMQMWAKPNEFEKYPRLLFGSIQRYNDVQAGFREWESRILRDAPYRKKAHYPTLEALRQWMGRHSVLFTSKANMQHLRTSLYARVFQYLYPRRVLANAYCIKHRGKLDSIDSEQVERDLPQSITEEVQKLKETYSDDWETIVADTKANLIANAAYYSKMLKGEEVATPLEEAQEAETLESEEVSP